MKKLFLIFISLVFAHALFAQKDSSKAGKNFIAILKYAPFSLYGDYITPSTGVQIGAEIMIGKRWSVQQDFDYIWKRKGHDTTNYNFPGIYILKSLKGYRTDTEIKFYLKEKKQHLQGFYVAAHFLYQYTEAIKNMLYYVKTDYDVYKRMKGLHGKIGYQFVIGEKAGLTIDVAVGAGMRWFKTKTKDYTAFDYEKETGICDGVNLPYIYPRHSGYEYGGPPHPFSVTGSVKIGFYYVNR